MTLNKIQRFSICVKRMISSILDALVRVFKRADNHLRTKALAPDYWSEPTEVKESP